jgi:hypothetical protein
MPAGWMLIQAIALSAFDALPPEAAGRAVLAARDHAPIVAVEPERTRTLQPPGVRERYLVERERRTPRGCVRNRWRAVFRTTPAQADPTLADVRPTPEIALPGKGGRCPADGYASLGVDLSPEAAFDALAMIEALRSGKRAPSACRDATPSRLCADRDSIRDALSAIAPWHIRRDGGDMVVWMGTPGQAVTEIRYAPADPARVAIERRIPAPA